jgi:hypothetical protein
MIAVNSAFRSPNVSPGYSSRFPNSQKNSSFSPRGNVLVRFCDRQQWMHITKDDRAGPTMLNQSFAEALRVKAMSPEKSCPQIPTTFDGVSSLLPAIRIMSLC